MKKIKALFASLTITRRELLLLLSGSAILSFGLYQVHSISGVTEGGVLGLTLLGHHWLGISPSVSSLILNAACASCWAGGCWRRGFVWRSIVAGGAFSLFYAVFEQFPILVPELSEHPLIAAVAGAMFVGVGVGLCVRAGGAPGGDDALSMSLEHVTHLPHPVDLPDQRSDRAGAVAHLHPAAAHPVFAADGHSVRPADRHCAARGEARERQRAVLRRQ